MLNLTQTRTRRKCCMCKNVFIIGDLISFNGKMYCQTCYKERCERTWFSEEVCKILNFKAPGPTIMWQRKMLKEKKGFTDKMIVDILRYYIQVKHLKFDDELGLLPLIKYVDEARQYYYELKEKEEKIVKAMESTAKHDEKKIIITVPKEEKKRTSELNPDDFLED